MYRFFQNTMHMSSDVSALLTDIVTLEKKIPTGCPTSQIIAYYAYHAMFEDIHTLATQRYGCIFTLYVDDMTFSSNSSFNPSQLSNDIDKILRRYGHKPKYSKVKYFPRSSHKLITGVVVSNNHKLLVANNQRKKIYDGAMKQLDLKLQGDSLRKELQTLKGRIQAAKNVNSKIFPEINRLVDNSIADLVNNYDIHNNWNRSVWKQDYR
ncbi:Reverse transcriptase (RNA-dependent DNA polymerase) [Fontibacillus panacisegetis]|uniref:Reverse transcriptase (RNA-dependent DNA polymerase) n=1 Tax=Fontibacillus panacisegetis TaxID=670482 RepID=A0A1G7M955_9BACL|nr:Reverse transcriptase (RNA-dependent DNA polymerase) [Fontibacillus panacisegetis]